MKAYETDNNWTASKELLRSTLNYEEDTISSNDGLAAVACQAPEGGSDERNF